MKIPRPIATLALTLAVIFSCATHAHAKPNILVILADDLGWGELGCQGFTQQIPTPNIDSSRRTACVSRAAT